MVISANATINVFDSIAKPIDAAFRQFLKLFVCFTVVMLIGKVINFLTKNETQDQQQDEMHAEEIETKEEQAIVARENQKKTVEPQAAGWDSEELEVNVNKSSEIVNVSAQKIKQIRRKCISVGPVMHLTTNSQFIRTLNIEDREERYHYDILPLETSADTEMVEDVCVL